MSEKAIGTLFKVSNIISYSKVIDRCQGLGASLGILYHEASQLQAHLGRWEIVNRMIDPLSFEEESSVLVVARNSWTTNLNDVHVVPRD